MADYIPSSDSEFTTWQENFLSYVNANLSALGLKDTDVASLNASQSTWKTDYSDHTKAQATAESARQTKAASRKSYESLVRSLVRRLQGMPNLTDAQRAGMQISLRETTRQSGFVPQSRPVVHVDTSQRLRHTINFTDEATPDSRSKPAGIHGCEVWAKIGDPAPTDGKGLAFLGLDTRTPYVAEYDGEQAGQTVHYMLRWVNAKGEAGPWSQTVSATVTK
jgi:hypothetical protein